MLFDLLSLILQCAAFYAFARMMLPFHRRPRRPPGGPRHPHAATPATDESASASEAFGTEEVDEAPYYPRTRADVQEVGECLSSLLLPELTGQIMDDAKYWVRERTERTGMMNVTGQRAGIEYLTTGPILMSPQLNSGDHVADEEDASSGRGEGGERMPNINTKWPVGEIVFTLSSRDQGWSGEPEHHNTYNHSWTWFEASVVPATVTSPPSPLSPPTTEEVTDGLSNSHIGQDTIPGQRRRHLQTNIHASRDFSTHTVTWTADAEDEEEREWVRSLKVGESVKVEVWARYPGWCNRVAACRVDVYVVGWR